MNNRIRTSLLALVVALLAVFPGCQGKPLSKAEAERVAVAKFQQFCSNFHVSSADFHGPLEDGEGTSHFVFKWEDRSEANRFTVLVMVQKDGEVNVSTTDQAKGPKYRHIAP